MPHNAQLVCSSKHFNRKSILTYVRDESPSSTLMDKIVRHFGRTNRLTINDKRYFYQPSDEYIQFVSRFKKKKF